MTDNTEHDTFLAILQNMSGKATNKAMKQELGWSDADYMRVRGELIMNGSIQLGRCRGGMVMFKEPDEKFNSAFETAASTVTDPFPSGWRDFD